MTKIFFATIFIVLFFIGASMFMKKTAEAPAGESDETPSKEASQNENKSPELPVDAEIEAIKAKDLVLAVINTAKGDITLELYPKVAPKTVTNFVKLANAKFYDGTKFHRVISDFMIQGGDPLSKQDDSRVGTGGPGYKFEDEINPKALGLTSEQIAELEARGYVYDFSLKSMKVDVGTIAMANSGPNTNGSQFFIVTQKAQPHLYGLHTVFGKVTKGMEVVRSIEQGDIITKLEITGMVP